MTIATLTLPADPNLDHLKKQAKQFLRDARAQRPEALQSVLEFHPRPAAFASLRDAQLVLARMYGFADWPALNREVDLRRLRSSTPDEQVERLIRDACLRYDGNDQAWHFERATEWLRQLPDLSARDFYCALAAADLPSVTRFLKIDSTLAVRDGGPRNWPPLMYLTYSRLEQSNEHSLDVAKILLDHGASPDSRSTTPSGFTALTGAVGGGESGPIACPEHPRAEELVRLLLGAGANPNQSQALYNAMLGDQLSRWLKLFVQHGLKAGDRANWSDDDQEPIFDFLLSFEVGKGEVELVRFLLEHDANPNAVSRYNHHSAHAVARLTGRADIADLLEQFGARILPLSVEDRFALALHRKDTALAADILAQHSQLLQNNELISNCAIADMTICSWLLQQGFDINAANQGGQTLLHRYASANNSAAISMLLIQGADPNVKEKTWHATPLGMALHHQHWQVVKLLLPVTHNLFDLCRVADVERVERLLAKSQNQLKERLPSGNTALHVISQAKQDDPDVEASIATIEVLLKYGADATAVNNEGMAPMRWYRQLGMDELADYLADRLNRV